jgi:hypothetical protein
MIKELEKFKEECIRWGLSPDESDQAMNIIWEIGARQEIDTRGISIHDIQMGKILRNFLIQGYIYNYDYYSRELYALDDHGNRIFQDIQKERVSLKIESLRKDIASLRSIFLLKYRDDTTGSYYHNLDGIKIVPSFKYITSHSEYGNKIENIFRNEKNCLIDILNKYHFIIKHSSMTIKKGFQQKKGYIIHPIIQLLDNDSIKIKDSYLKAMDVLNKRVCTLNLIIKSIDNPSIRKELEYTAVKDFIKQVENDGLVFLDATTSLGFKISKPDEFRKKIDQYRQKLIDETTKPIINYLLNGTDATKTFEKKSINEKKLTESLSKSKQKTEETLIIETETLPKTNSTDKSNLSILLGYDENSEVYWFPKKENSWNFIVVGSAGTGKTQTVKAILKDFDKNNIPYIIFDFRKDYCSENESQFGQVLDLKSFSINPLEIEGKNSPKDQKYQISDIINLIYNIGPKQIGFIRKSIKESYENKGVYESKSDTWSNHPPTFNDIQKYLTKRAEDGTSTEKNTIQGIFSRLDPIFDYNVFSPETIIKFQDIIKTKTIINLSSLPSDDIKSIVCEFFLRKLRYYLYEKGSSRDPILYVIIDEAHRLKYDKNSSIGQLLKESRKYGAGIVLSTQDPVDFTDLVYNNVGGILTLQLTDPKYAKNIAQHLGGDVDWKFVKNKLSDKFSACVKFSRNDQSIKFRVTPQLEREQN